MEPENDKIENQKKYNKGLVNLFHSNHSPLLQEDASLATTSITHHKLGLNCGLLSCIVGNVGVRF